VISKGSSDGGGEVSSGGVVDTLILENETSCN
jgi:hypothetical protein